MNYTESDASVVHVGTGNRMHQSSAPVTTEVSANDMNMLIWSLMEVVKAAGLTGVDFDPDIPSTRQRLLLALNTRYLRGNNVSSVAALRGLPKSVVPFAFVAGYYAVGDGGGGHYFLDADDTTSADNGGTVIVADDGGRWKLTGGTSAVTLEQFGGGGSRSALENASAANRACVWCFSTGATLRLKGVTYLGASIEVHGAFSVEGNGATVDFLGVGNTLIGGTGSGTSAVPTAWPGDSGGDPGTLYTVKSWAVASPVAIGDDTITFASTAGMVVGSTIFLADNPSTVSSPGNFVPANFEFAQILSIAGNVVTLNGKARNTYTAAGAAFYSPGLARNGKVSNLRLKSLGSTPYQAVVRSAVNYELVNIEFAGRDALGAATFVEGFTLTNARATGCGGSWSFARGAVRAELDGLVFQYRSTLGSETSCVFVEESLYDVTIRGVRGFGASFSVRVLDMASTNIKRSITIYDSTFDTTNAPGGATAPIQMGTAAGVDIEAYGCTFAGAAVTPNPSIYPGVTGTAMGWVTSNQTTDKIKFSACHFKGSTTGVVFTKGSGALGQVIFDAACTYETIDAPSREYTPMGGWVDMAGNFAGGVTVPAGSVARYRYTPWDVTVTARIQLNGLATGSTFFSFPAALRPQVEKRFVCATDATDRIGIVRVLPGGNLIYVGSTAAPALYVDCQFTFPLDS